MGRKAANVVPRFISDSNKIIVLVLEFEGAAEPEFLEPFKFVR